MNTPFQTHSCESDSSSSDHDVPATKGKRPSRMQSNPDESNEVVTQVNTSPTQVRMSDRYKCHIVNYGASTSGSSQYKSTGEFHQPTNSCVKDEPTTEKDIVGCQISTSGSDSQLSQIASATEHTESAFNEGKYQCGENTGAHGNKYENDLAFVMFVRSSLKERRFKLATEMVDAGKFDDIVLFVEELKKAYLFQAKHAEIPKPIECKELFPSEKRMEGKDFDLYKYVRSYFYVEQNLKTDGNPKKYFIVTNRSLQEDEELHKLVDVVPRKEDKLMHFSKVDACYKGFQPNEKTVSMMKDKMNKEFFDLKDAIIRLCKSGEVGQILKDYKTPLLTILETSDNCLKFRDESEVNSGDISQKVLYKELQTYLQQEKQDLKRVKIKKNKAVNDLLQGKSRNTVVQLPPFVDDITVKEFFDRLTFCVNLSSKDLSTIVNDDVRLWLMNWIKPDDLGKFGKSQLILPREMLQEEFKNWQGTKLESKHKLFISHESGQKCIQGIKNELKQCESKHSDALDYYVNRFINVHEVDSNNQEILCISDESLLEQLKHNFISNKCSSFILIAEPGMGKTTLLQNVGFEVQKRFKKDVFMIYLKNFDKKLETVDSNDIKEIIPKMLGNVLKDASLQILQEKLGKNGIFFLFDGFDEIAASQEANAITLFKNLLETEKVQLIISGRKHVQEILVKELNAKVMSLVPLQDDEQMQFLRSFWNIPIDTTEKSKNDKFVKFSTLLLKKFHSDIGRWSYSFTGLPLIIRMLAEIHSKSIHQFFESESTDPTGMFSSEKFSVLKLFEKFVEISFNMTVKKKEGREAYSEIDTYNADDIMQPSFERFVIEHQLIAIKTLAVRQLDNIIEENEYSKINERLLMRIKKGTEKSLLISFTSEGSSVDFNHLSFAEYFVAMYLYYNVNIFKMRSRKWLNISLKNKKEKKINGCLKDLFKILNQHQVVQRFFFWLIEEHFDESAKQIEIVDNICSSHTDVAFWACEASCVKVVKMLLENRNFQNEVDKNGNIDDSLLHVATRVGCNALVSYLLCEHGIHADKCNKYRYTPLHMSAEKGHLEIVKVLIDRSANVNAQNDSNDTPLHLALAQGHLEIVKVLIDRSANVNAQNRYEETPLHLAVKQGHLAIVQVLFDRKANVNAQKYNGETPLHLALKNGHFDIVKMLIDRSANVNAQNIFKETPLQLAVEQGHLEIIKVLIDRKANVNDHYYKGETPLHLAVEQGQLEIVKVLIDRKANVNALNYKGKTPLHSAVAKGNLEMVKVLIDRSANVNAQIRVEETRLHWAVEQGHLEIGKVLIDRSANVNAQNNSNETPLQLAVEQGHLEIVKVLIDRSANVNAQNDSNETLLHLALAYGHLEIVNVLIDRSANVNAQDSFNYTPLHLAVAKGYLEIVKMLIDRKANLNAQNSFKETPLHLAVENGHLEMVKVLIDRKANLNAQNRFKETILHLAVENGHLEIVKVLIDRSAYVNAQNYSNETPLHLAVAKGHLEIGKVLIDRSAYVNAQNDSNETPLHLAAKKGNLKIVKMLIDRSANVNAQNYKNETPLHLAAKYSHLEIVKILNSSL